MDPERIAIIYKEAVKAVIMLGESLRKLQSKKFINKSKYHN